MYTHRRKIVRLSLVSIALLLPGMTEAAGKGEGPWRMHVIDNTSRGADGVKLADVNGDGFPDIVTGWEQGNVVKVYLHPGPASVRDPWPSVIVGAAPNVEDAVFIDLDQDGAMDVVSSCEGKTQSLFVHWAPAHPGDYLDASAWRTEAIPASVGRTRWMFTVPHQIDGLRGVDLIAGSKHPNGQIGWFASPDDPRDLGAWTYHRLSDAGWIMSLVARDMDDDGFVDILTSDRKDSDLVGVRWLKNPGPGKTQVLPWKNHFIARHTEQVMFLSLGDINHDTLMDVAVAVKPRDLIWYRNPGPGSSIWQSHTIQYPEQTGFAKAIAVGDVNLDGALDFVFSCESSGGQNGLMWMSYTHTPLDPTWEAHPLSGIPGKKFDLIEMVDLDGDGDLDVLTCEEAENLGVIWYENPHR